MPCLESFDKHKRSLEEKQIREFLAVPCSDLVVPLEPMRMPRRLKRLFGVLVLIRVLPKRNRIHRDGYCEACAQVVTNGAHHNNLVFCAGRVESESDKRCIRSKRCTFVDVGIFRDLAGLTKIPEFTQGHLQHL